MFDIALKEMIFAVPMFAEVAKTFIVWKEFETQTFPRTDRFADASVPIPILLLVMRLLENKLYMFEETA